MFFRRTRLCTRALAKYFITAVACLVAVGVAGGAKAVEVNLGDLIARYERAMTDPQVGKLTRFELAGTLVGAGSEGTFHIWHDGDNERLDQNLGLRRERKIRIGERFFFIDESGYAREYHGVLLRHSRTEALIDSGELSATPRCCKLLGSARIGGRVAYELAVTAEGGDTEFLYLDAETALPMRLAYDSDDGLTSIDLSDWRTVNGRRFAFRNVASDGNRAFDLTQITTSAVVDAPIDAALFVIPRSRGIEMTGVQHVALSEHDGHFFVPVKISGRTFQFLLDSGAQGILLDRHVARTLNLHEEGTFEASGAKRTGGLRLAKLCALHIGGATIRNSIVATLDLGASTHGAFRIDGILGYPFFASAVVRIDFAGKMMSFGPPGSLAGEGDYIDVDLDRGLSEAMLSADGVRAPFMIDTGNAADVLLYGPFVTAHPGIVPSTLADMRSYGLGGSTDSYRSLLRELVLGTTTLRNVNVGVMLATQGAFADRFDAGNIGLGVLRNFIVTFDYPNEALYFEKSGNTSAMER
jgi:hypothetical protein